MENYKSSKLGLKAKIAYAQASVAQQQVSVTEG
jgi:hypothetical protein